jgi:hypothetical protein
VNHNTCLGVVSFATPEPLAPIAERALYKRSRKSDHSEFCHALKSGKEFADGRVEGAFFRRAIGYSFDVVKIDGKAKT